MTGVEILETEMIVVDRVFSWKACSIAFCITAALFLVIGIAVSRYYNDPREMITGLVIGIVAGAVAGYAFGSDYGTPTDYSNKQIVVVSDEVPMNEFLEKYEIIDHEDKIYTVIERD